MLGIESTAGGMNVGEAMPTYERSRVDLSAVWLVIGLIVMMVIITVPLFQSDLAWKTVLAKMLRWYLTLNFVATIALFLHLVRPVRSKDNFNERGSTLP